MSNLIFISSIIDPPKLPLSYSTVRSVFNRTERYEQTKKTIESLCKYIPNISIILVECSNFDFNNKEHVTQYVYFKTHCKYFINIWDDELLRNRCYSAFKGIGEGTQTIAAINFILNNEIKFDSFYKISGRYFINNNFNYDLYKDNKNIAHHILNYDNIINTTFIKLLPENLKIFKRFLKDNEKNFLNNAQYELIVCNFYKSLNQNNTLLYTNNFNYVSGLISVDGDKLN